MQQSSAASPGRRLEYIALHPGNIEQYLPLGEPVPRHVLHINADGKTYHASSKRAWELSSLCDNLRLAIVVEQESAAVETYDFVPTDAVVSKADQPQSDYDFVPTDADEQPQPEGDINFPQFSDEKKREINSPSPPVINFPQFPNAEPVGKSGETIQFLPNSVREKLLASGKIAACRVYEALAVLGWNDARLFDAAEAIAACVPFGISSKVTREALSAENAILFPLLHPNTHQECINALDITVYRRGRGRPPGSSKRYRLAAALAICKELGVAATYSDPIPLDSLKSSDAYRQALAGALLTRAPGVYTVDWLAGRIGVTRRTLQSYHANLGVVAEPRQVEIELTAANFETELPGDNRKARRENLYLSYGGRAGKFTPTQKEYLRMRGEEKEYRVILTRQIGNYYSIPEGRQP